MGKVAAPIDPTCSKFATPTQAKYLEAFNRLGTIQAVAKEFDINHSAISRSLQSLRAKAAMAGLAPESGMTHEVPAPFVVKGVSTLYDENGNRKLQWVKSKLDNDLALQAVQEWIESLTDEVKGRSPLVAPPERVAAELLAAYPYGDPHFGLYAWEAEAGADFDLVIAERVMCGAIDRLLKSAPETETGLILILGDTFHANDQSNVTPGHKHQLDVDSRYPKVIMAGIKSVRYIILKALEKHKKVIVRIEPGNHDPQAKWALTFALKAYFDNNPRVEIDTSPSKFWYYSFGRVLIGSTHGDTIKHNDLPGVMAADKPMEWGHAKHRYWYTGHVHTQAVREYAGVICESFRSLVARDAWNTSHGYRSGRDLFCIIHHQEHGEIERHRCDLAMI